MSIFRLARLLACLGLPLPHKRRQTCVHSHNFNTLKLKKNTENIRPFNSLLPNISAKEEKRLVDATVSDGYYKKHCTKFSSSSKEASVCHLSNVDNTVFAQRLRARWVKQFLFLKLIFFYINNITLVMFINHCNFQACLPDGFLNILYFRMA